MKYPKEILEEELKNKVGKDLFGDFDSTEIKGKIDFAVKPVNSAQESLFGEEYFLWAEAKAAVTDVLIMLTQLTLTVGKAKTHEKINPPHFLGCFDREKIALVPYFDIQERFFMNDFNWKVAPSDHETKEFKLISDRINAILTGEHTYVFKFSKDEKELKEFIKKNFIPGKDDTAKIKITKNNFKWVYDKWVAEVKPSINVNWDAAKKSKIKDGAFYLADLLSENNKTLIEKLFVLLKTDYYELDRQIDDSGFFNSKKAEFKDGQKAHTQFWAKYERPPKDEYWDYIIDRQDLLVPQDIREREGSFYTPKIWVELSQKYIADVLGEDWQDEYYVWDCAAGTGNLLAGLTNPRNIWASTLDKADVAVMKTMGVLFENHVFQFDFLNDDFKKLPEELQEIINDEEKRKRLIVYINPPYAEDTTKSNFVEAKFKGNVAKNVIHDKYAEYLKKANHELFAQFLTRIYFEIHGCKIGEFSTQKALIAPNFKDFRNFFVATLKKCFVMPANTFDNVLGKFPIGFKIWDTSGKKHFKRASVDVFDEKGCYIGKKIYQDGVDCKYINDWIKKFRDDNGVSVATLFYVGNDFQHNNFVTIENKDKGKTGHYVSFDINFGNLIFACIYYAIRKVIPATWLNDRDQFLFPNDDLQNDTVFQNDCVTYTLFNNHISSNHGTNHWIPFTEQEVGVHRCFKSGFMTDFIAGKIKPAKSAQVSAFEDTKRVKSAPLKFSPEAKAVFAAGRELWRYYHKQPHANANASLYDIREHFQGRNEKGKMNNKSPDETYNKLIGVLRDKLKVLAKKIEPKIYEYGFLRS
jgi:hypothetical protein